MVAIFISVTFYAFVKNTIYRNMNHHLESLSETKAIRVQDMLDKKFDMAQILQNSPRIYDNLVSFHQNPSPELVRKMQKPLQNYKKRIASLNEVHIVNPEGKIISSTDESDIGAMFTDMTAISTKELKKNYAGNFYFEKDGEYSMIVSAPITLKGNHLGAIVLMMDAKDVVSLTKDHTGLGVTGETVLAKRNKDGVYLTPLRFDEDAALKRVVRIEDTNNVVGKALQGQQGLIYGTDYRGESVIASSRYIPETGWALITKMDRKEVAEPIHYLRDILLVINLFAILIALVAAYIAGSRIAKPIQELNSTVSDISEGDYSKRVKIRTKNEIGKLEESFNSMAEQLERKMKLLTNSNESLNKFAYVISHDLKAPVHSLNALANILFEEYRNKPLDAEGRSIVEMIIGKSKHMEELIAGVLESARKGFTDETQKEVVNTYDLVTEIISNINPPENIKINVSPDLPEVKYNKIGLYQVFQNLIGNAVKYNDKDTGIIDVEYEKLGKKVRFCVKDNGPGIKEKDFQDIFAMFSKGKHENIDSSGIGLSIVKKIVTDHNGEIWVESKEGEGSIFCFTVPEDRVTTVEHGIGKGQRKPIKSGKIN